MKKELMTVLMGCFMGLLSSVPAGAAVSGAELPKASEPLLVTSAGQGPGCKMGRLLINRSGAVKTMTFNAEPQPVDLESGAFKTIVVVIGSSAKGLGASGITIDQEIERLHAVMKKAKDMGIQVIAVHIEGTARRGKPGSTDERSIEAILPFASHILVVKAGDADQKFINFGQQQNVPVTYMDAALDLEAAAKTIFGQ